MPICRAWPMRSPREVPRARVDRMVARRSGRADGRAASSATQVRGVVELASSPRFLVDADWPGIDVKMFEQFEAGLRDDYRAVVERFLALEALGSPDPQAELRDLRMHVFERGEPSLAALTTGMHWLETADLRAQMPQLAMPSLWIAGRRDRLVPPAAMRRAAALAANGRFVEVPSGHAPFIGLRAGRRGRHRRFRGDAAMNGSRHAAHRHRVRPRGRQLRAARGVAARCRRPAARTARLRARGAVARARSRQRTRTRNRGAAQTLFIGAGDRARYRDADADADPAKLAAPDRARVRGRARAAVRRCEHRCAVFEPVPAMDRRSAGAVQRIAARAAAGRLRRVFDVRTGFAVRIARGVVGRRRHAAREPLHRTSRASAMRSSPPASAIRCWTSNTSRSPTTMRSA